MLRNCNPHPQAPHGFVRNASHNSGDYVCECHSWDPYQAGYNRGYQDALDHIESQEYDTAVRIESDYENEDFHLYNIRNTVV